MNNIDLNNNNNNTSEDERLKSVSFDLGTKNNLVESILQNNKENILQEPIKEILKINSNDDIEIGLTIIKICSIIAILILSIPFIFCDLYFGYTDTTCVLSKPSGLNISMKLYLLVSGFIGIGIILILIGVICLLSNNDNKNNYLLYSIAFIGILAVLFQFVWNILGGIVFWGTVYKEGNCSESTSSYIFVSLIIKLVVNLININYNFNKKK